MATYDDDSEVDSVFEQISTDSEDESVGDNLPVDKVELDQLRKLSKEIC
jgi:hypothetical protein